MTFEIRLRQESKNDLRVAFEYYEQIRQGLGQDFLLCFENSLAKIQRTPMSFKVVYSGLRRIAIRRFPYRIFYIVDDSTIVITAIFHVRQNPESWQYRT
ncbi:type II toxin-antitoxin system RelE/ParE family toxin [Glaciecola sp. MH2013]|uniref:type II toxin-antitoxin system RelE/ParE family toxin n=1 Tax=Glaciecola sp. MH2013 TaxID=2785524 RepID=UPI00189CC9F2|nr:type II toxin-antitoxin system RelE/ParE family toxin [Glaciecola sp. MH2013]